ncbi:MAG: ABC transporter substrate-binding protein [Rhodospirillales bacterium]|nr:ABC transporter substrate-binding protein [Rhodospirillales bacterium]
MFQKSLLGLVAMCALAGATAAQAQKPGGVANAIIQPEPPGLMLAMVQNGPTQMVAGNIYEGLLRYNDKLAPQPGLAESWKVSDDGKVYTFNLAKNATWHDGKPFTSADVVFTLEFIKQTNPRARANLVHVDKVEAPDANTVVITLKQPFGPFIGIFEVGSLPMVPKHIYDGIDWKTAPANNTPIGTGPFMFKEWQKGSFIKLVKNPNYHVKGKPHLDEIYWHVIPDAAARSVAFETGKVDILPGGSVENFDVPRLTKLKDVCITGKGWEFFGPLAWMWLNNRQGPTANKKFRQAVMYAIDRDFGKDVVWNGLGKVAVGPISSATKFFDPKLAVYKHDPAKAKALLKESGYKGEKVRFMPLPYGETWTRWGEAVRQNLQDVGINLEMVATDVPGYNQKLSEWDYDIGFSFLYQYGDPALGVARSYITSNIAKGSPFNNVEGYSNPEVDKLFAEAATAFPDSKRQELYNQVMKILIDDVPVAWLLELEFPTITRCSVKNLVTTAIGVNDGFRDAWLEK